MDNTNNNITLESVIDEFLAEYDEPNAEQWARLSSKHPEFASDIVDYSILYSGMNDLNESDIISNIGEDVYEASVSSALEMALQSPNVVDSIQDKIANIKGKSLRELACEVELDDAPKLLSEILQGVTIAPTKILELLAKKYNTSHAIMLSCLQRRFESSIVPSYKASFDKPEINIKQRTWEESVQLLGLSDDITKKLLDLDV